jgi:chromosome segregation ATPase
LALALLKFSWELWPLLLWTLLGFIACSTGKRRGLWIALCGVAILAVYNATAFSKDLLWWGSLSGSMLIGLSLTYLAKVDAEEIQGLHQQEMNLLEEKILSLQKALKETQMFGLQEKNVIYKELEAVRLKFSECLEEAAAYQDQLQLQNQEIDTLKEAEEKKAGELKEQCAKTLLLQETLAKAGEQINLLNVQACHENELIEELNETRSTIYQLTVLKDVFYEQNQLKDKHLMVLTEELNQLSEPLQNPVVQVDDEQEQKMGLLERNYRQLKAQFEEKSDILNQTRKELFQVEGALFALQSINEQKGLDTIPQEMILIDELKQADAHCQELEAELNAMQELITSLVGKKKTTRGRKTKVAELDLDLTFSSMV